MMLMRNLVLPLLCLAALLSGCATNPVTGDQDLVFMSEQDEIQLGKQVQQQVLQQYHVYNDVELQNYVQYVGDKLAGKSHRPNLDYTFTVLDSDEVNAFALPGGHVYITRGIMAYLNSEAQLAAVLGHEIGHVTARHAVRQQSASQLAGLGAALGAALIPGMSQYAGQQLTGMIGTALLRGYGREHELEADRLGAQYLARSGYDPDAMLDVIRTLKSQEAFEVRLARAENREPHVYHGLFASHPDNDTRLKQVVASAEQYKTEKTTFIGSTDYLRRIDGLTFGESTSNGIIKDRNFYHGAMNFAMRFPQGWQIRNLPDRVMAVSPDNNAMIQLNALPADPGLTPQQFMADKLDIKSMSHGQDLTVHGLPAHTATAPINTGNGQNLARVTVIYHDRTAFILAGITRNPRSLGGYDNDFLDTARSFRPLTAAEQQLAVQNKHLRLIQAGQQTNYKDLAAGAPIDKFPEDQLRLLNGDYPRGQIRSGELLKTVEQ